MHEVGSILIDEYNYGLPETRIAKFPLSDREQSKLLFMNKEQISEKRFTDLPGLLPKNSLLVFNETKVIRARLRFRKETGALIEIFCLEPVQPSNDFQIAFQKGPPVVWKCLVGNAKRWKSGTLNLELKIENKRAILSAQLIDKLSDAFLVAFNWQPVDISFADIIAHSGVIPLPPYLNREAEESDNSRYQTVYARYDGSVAAPTAGLHFTDEILTKVQNKGHEFAKVTLHVGAGTFKPVISNAIANHEMHTEKIVVGLSELNKILQYIDNPIIPVGTTSMRTLESLFWLGYKISQGYDKLVVDQWDPYQLKVSEEFTSKKALLEILAYLENNQLDELKTETSLMIAPGYTFKLCNGIVTNFHQPKSTLLLLVSALVGDRWKQAYDFALENEFRFLSYGDSCLFLP